MDGLRGMYTSVTHTCPNEFRVVLVSREIEEEGPGLSTRLVLMGMEKLTRIRWTGSDQAVHLEKVEETNRVSRARSTRNECRRIRVSITMEARWIFAYVRRWTSDIGVAGRGISPTLPARPLHSVPIHPQLRPRRPTSLNCSALSLLWTIALKTWAARRFVSAFFIVYLLLMASPRTRWRSNFSPAPSFYLFPRHRPSARSVPVPVR